MSKKKQHTIDVNGHKIKIESWQKTHQKHPNGFKVRVSDSENYVLIPHTNTLYREVAEDRGFVEFVKRFAK